MVSIQLRLLPEEAARVMKALEVAGSGNRADGAVALAEAALGGKLAGDGTSVRPPVEVVVHVQAADLEGRTELGDGISAEVSRRLLCDAGVVPMLEDERGKTIDVGRKTRTIPAALRRALDARDRGCRFPGCTNRIFTDAHHVEHWLDGGETVERCPGDREHERTRVGRGTRRLRSLRRGARLEYLRAVTSRLDDALARFDAVNAEDPRREGEEPYELVYARRMTAWLERLAPDAPEELRLAVRAQHIGRWRLPRDRFPDGRAGYKRWRSECARMHADTAAAILEELGHEAAAVQRVRDLLTKRGLAHDPAVQTLEDVACLVFLEHYLADFAQKHARDKLVDIVRKTWAKMSERGRAAAATIPLPPHLAAVVADALG